MKNFIIISAVFPPEPVVSAKLSSDIAHALSENHTVTVISPKPSRPFGFNFSGDKLYYPFNHIQLGSYFCASSSIIGRFKESYSFGKQCNKYIEDHHNNIAIIYANTWPLLGQYFAVKASRKYNIPIIIHVQDIYPESLVQKLPKLKQLVEILLLPLDKYILRNATQVVAISDQMKNYLAATRNLKEEKIVVVQNWQDEAIFIQHKSTINPLSEKKKQFIFMYLGNIGPVAGIELLINAYDSAGLPNSKLIIAGSGAIKETLQGMVKKMNSSSIEFWTVPEGKVPEIQEHADVMLLPIKKGAAMSSIPSKLPAYMFSAKPIIACVDEDSDTASTIVTANCGWVLPPENEDSLIQTMSMVSKITVEELQQKGKNGFEFAIEHFSKRKNLKKLCDMITETIPA